MIVFFILAHLFDYMLVAGFVVQWNKSSKAMSRGNSHSLKINFLKNTAMVSNVFYSERVLFRAS